METQVNIQFEPIEPNRNNQVFSPTSEQTISSLEIAEITGKPHNDVLKAIRAMEPAWTSVTEGKFSLSTYKDPTGRTLPCYALTKTECLYVATKFNDEARAKLVIRWEQLERARISNLPDFSNPAAAARAWAEQYERNEQLLAQNKQQSLLIEQKDAEIEEIKQKYADIIRDNQIKDEDIKKLLDELRRKNNVAAVEYIFNNDTIDLYTWKQAADIFFGFTSFNVLLEYLKLKKWISDSGKSYSPLAPFIGSEENGGKGYMEYYRPFHYEGDKKVFTSTLKLTQKGALAAKFLYDKDVRLGNISLIKGHIYKKDKDGEWKRVPLKKFDKKDIVKNVSPYGTEWEN